MRVMSFSCFSQRRRLQQMYRSKVAHFSAAAYAAFGNVLQKVQSKSTKSPRAVFNEFVSSNMHRKLTPSELDAVTSACMSIIEENSRDEIFPSGKQKLFADTLRDFDAAMHTAGQSYFLAAGTALGAIRDGRFIDHDDDIDIGVFYRKGETERTMEGLMHALQKDFTLFQRLGTINHGYELRFLHNRTRVHLDINWFYVEEGTAPFLWCATYYGGSDTRKFQKYRYKHSLFIPQKLPFAGGSYYVPPKRFLEEYYGKDWETPKKFDYWEGLAGEYKNIIPE